MYMQLMKLFRFYGGSAHAPIDSEVIFDFSGADGVKR